MVLAGNLTVVISPFHFSGNFLFKLLFLYVYNISRTPHKQWVAGKKRAEGPPGAPLIQFPDCQDCPIVLFPANPIHYI